MAFVLEEFSNEFLGKKFTTLVSNAFPAYYCAELVNARIEIELNVASTVENFLSSFVFFFSSHGCCFVLK